MSSVIPISGPRWTRKRLVDMLIDCYGPSPRGRVNTAAVADYAGVTPGTVYRWIAGGPQANRRTAHIPAARLAQLQRGPRIVEERNQQQYDHALTAVANIGAGKRILPSWRKQGWLDEHTIAIVEVHEKPWQQVIVTYSLQGFERRRHVTVIDSITLPNKFAADILAHHVMVRQQNWRVHPAKTQLALGRTQVWMADAPRVDLAELAR
jgi:hypothetical protein